ncbi:MAG: CoA transferase [Dehalococcoidia bacterium]
MPPPLHGVRVLELGGWNVAFAGRLLADGGADVVRVVPATGDPLNLEPPFLGASGVSIQSTWYNAGKRVSAVPLDAPAGKRALRRLISRADILLEDWHWLEAPLTADEVRAANPSLVRVSVTPFGHSGPWAHFELNDLVANALCGAASVTGDATTPPLSGWGNQTAHTVGLYAAFCALASLRAARATGEFQWVDLSAHEALISCTEQLVMQWFFPTGGSWKSAVAPRQGSLHWSGGYQVYPDRNGQGLMVTAALRLMEDVLPWLVEEGAAQDLADPEKYPTVISLVRDFPHVMEVMRAWVATRDARELFFEAQRRRLSFGVVLDIEESLASPQLAAREYIQSVDLPGAGPTQLPGRLFRTSADEGHITPPTNVEVASIDWSPRPPHPPAPAPLPDPARPLAGVRVLDFTHVLAGPFGTRALADLGADVIKVSSASRAGGANSPAHPYYACWNRNKRSIMVNMATPEGKDVCRRLAGRCDVVIDNFAAGVLARWGLDRASLEPANPGVTVISMSGMGSSGPWKDFVTFAPTIHALTGLTYLTNPPGRHDLGYGFSLSDHLSGLAAAFAALEALQHRDRTGQGLDIDLAQYELGLGIMAPTFIDFLANGVRHEPVGNRDPWASWAPHSIYRCAGDDAWVAIAARGDSQFADLCAALALPHLVDDARFATHAGRVANQDSLDAAIEACTSSRDRYEVMRAVQARLVPCGVVQDAEDLAVRDPQVAHRAFFTTGRSQTQWGEYGLEHFPALFNGQRPTYDGVHDLGADTFDVLTELLALPDAELAELMANGTLA